MKKTIFLFLSFFAYILVAKTNDVNVYVVPQSSLPTFIVQKGVLTVIKLPENERIITCKVAGINGATNFNERLKLENDENCVYVTIEDEKFSDQAFVITENKNKARKIYAITFNTVKEEEENRRILEMPDTIPITPASYIEFGLKENITKNFKNNLENENDSKNNFYSHFSSVSLKDKLKKLGNKFGIHRYNKMNSLSNGIILSLKNAISYENITYMVFQISNNSFQDFVASEATLSEFSYYYPSWGLGLYKERKATNKSAPNIILQQDKDKPIKINSFEQKYIILTFDTKTYTKDQFLSIVINEKTSSLNLKFIFNPFETIKSY